MKEPRNGQLGEARGWLESLGFTVSDEALWLEALTHGSTASGLDYQRLEFLGDRVLGLSVAEWLYRGDDGAEGELAQRLNALVSRATCANVARAVGAPQHLRLGKQARDDGGLDSENILCDVIEALLGASFLESGFEPTRDVVHSLWADAMFGGTGRRKHPIDRSDYIKRVIGLPGDTIQMVAGVLHIDGVPVKKERIADFVRPIGPYNECRAAFGRFRDSAADGTTVCRYPRFRETLPSGRTYEVLDFGLLPQDTTPAVVVPEGHLFLMGDNRDNSLDSRFPAEREKGIGLVPVENLVSRAEMIAFSTDGTSSWINPVSWFTAARGERIGDGL